MKKTTIRSLICAALTGALVTSCQQEPEIAPDNLVRNSSSQVIAGQYIVVYNTQRTGNAGRLFQGDRESSTKYVADKIYEIFQSNALKKPVLVQVFSQSINGVAVKLTESELTALKQDSRVAYVEEDKVVALAPPQGKPGGPAAQETPWGISRVNGVSNYTGSNVAWVIDTGIDLDHPDLNVDVRRSESFVTWGGPNSASPNDENGHGTHVAGTIAAINNSIGVIGVAAGSNCHRC
jgi:subtilisin family serine protease